MVENVLLAKKLYPGWSVRIHYNDTVPSTIIEWLKTQDNTELVYHPGTKKKASNMFWRFEDMFTDWTVIVRDADSRLNIREKAAVDEWLESNKDFHIMRDHEHHLVPIVGGAFGCRDNACKYLPFPNNSGNYNVCPFDFVEGKHVLDKFVNSIDDTNDYYMMDQKFLYHYVYPHVVLQSMVHASHNAYEPFAKQFPDTSYTGVVVGIITSAPDASIIFNDTETDFERVGYY
jgi:hypothetical protein